MAEVTSCEGCGACCLTQESPPGYVLMFGFGTTGTPEDDERWSNMPAALKAELETYVNRLKAGLGHPNDRICLWYDEDTKGCKHYEFRPQICRDMPVGGELCLGWRQLYQIGES